MKKNVLCRFLALACVCSTAGSLFAACNKKGVDTEQTLEIMIWDAGYGTAWCDDMLEAFKQEDWVKEKYPNLKTQLRIDPTGGMIDTIVSAGERANTVDLIFCGKRNSDEGKNAAGYEYLANLTEAVFHQKIPGEDRTVYEKMDDAFLDTIQYFEKGTDSNTPNLEYQTYAFPWAGGMNGIIYNADHLKAMNVEVPLTTKQLVETCERVISERPFAYQMKENGNFVIQVDGTGGYWPYIYPIWWGQYEGVEEYYNFFNGVSNGRISSNVHRQKGKLYSLEVLEDLLEWDNAFLNSKRTALDYIQAQTNFLRGEGVFMANGDWFANEMRDIAKDIKDREGIDYDIRMMKTPIVSEIIEKTPTIPNEETLRAVIRAVDLGYENKSSAIMATFEDYELIVGVNEADYQTILKARGISSTTGTGHGGHVFSYAKGKEIAFDFLLFMATDKGNDIYLKATNGAYLPFDYNVKVKNPELYNSFFALSQDVLDMKYESAHGQTVLPDAGTFPLVKWGGMAAVYSLQGNSIVSYFAAKDNTATARDLYENDIRYYIDGGQFDYCRSRAGLS